MFWTFFSSKTETVPFDCKQFSRIPMLSIHPTVQCANIDKPIKYFVYTLVPLLCRLSDYMHGVVSHCAAATSMRTPRHWVEGVPPEYH